MTTTHTSTNGLKHRPVLASHRHNENSAVENLLEENAKLRKLVVELSRIAIKNVADKQ
jgi:hypothetical protein